MTTDTKTKTEAVWSAVCEATWDADATYLNDNIDCKRFLIAGLRELVNQLKYQSFHHTEEYYQLNVDDVMIVIDELEAL